MLFSSDDQCYCLEILNVASGASVFAVGYRHGVVLCHNANGRTTGQVLLNTNAAVMCLASFESHIYACDAAGYVYSWSLEDPAEKHEQLSQCYPVLQIGIINDVGGQAHALVAHYGDNTLRAFSIPGLGLLAAQRFSAVGISCMHTCGTRIVVGTQRPEQRETPQRSIAVVYGLCDTPAGEQSCSFMRRTDLHGPSELLARSGKLVAITSRVETSSRGVSIYGALSDGSGT